MKVAIYYYISVVCFTLSATL